MRAFWFGMAVHLWQTTLVLAVLLVLDRFMRRAPARLRHLLWSAGLLKLLVPFPLLVYLWPSLSTLGSAFGRESPGPALVTLGRIASPRLLVEPAAGPGVAPSVGEPFVLITALWAVVVALLLGRWLWRTRCAVIAGRRPWEMEAAPLGKVERAAGAAGIPLGRLHITDQPVMPCVRRLARSIVVVPRVAVEQLEAEELRAIMLHEEAHRSRKDLWWNVAQGLAARIFFFYPPAWWLSRRLRETAEMACDEAVLGAGVDAAAYARALATTVRFGLTSAAVPSLAAHSGSPLTRRLARLTSNERYFPMTRHKMCIGLAFVFALFLSLAPLSGGGGLAMTSSSDLATSRAGGQETPSSAIMESLTSAWTQEGLDLSRLSGIDRQVTLRHHDVPLTSVYEDLGRQAGFTVYFGSSVDSFGTISVAVSDATIREVLELLAEDADIEYRVIDAETLAVRLATERQVEQERRAEQERPVKKVVKRTPAAAGPTRVGGDIQEPEKILHINPKYTDEARRARLEGFVVLEAVIDKEGDVRDVEVLRGLGMGLDEAAVAAVKQWKYTPTLYDGEPVEVVVTISVVFQLIQ